MKTYVVHWKQAPERRQHIAAHFPDLDLEFIDKYDKSDVTGGASKTMEVFPEMRRWFKDEVFYSNNHVCNACVAMSHIESIMKFAESGEKQCIIIEDDAVKIYPDFKHKLNMYIDELQSLAPDWDILCINDAKAGSDIRRLLAGCCGTQFIKMLEMRQTAAYLVSAPGAKKILEILDNKNGLGLYENSCLDNWLSRLLLAGAPVNCWWTIAPLIINGNKMGKFKRTYNYSVKE
tara:strand:- start:2882 stop:3580 length:699 start_codon:yes stop_codon:yes gene_type:complete